MLEYLQVSPSNAEVREVIPSLEDVFVTLSRAAEAGHLPSISSAGVTHTEPPIPPGLPVDSLSVAGQPAADTPAEGDCREQTWKGGYFGGWWAILTKEFAHIQRERSTLFCMFVVPVVQLLIFGVALDTQVEHLPTVLYDLDGRAAARELASAFVNTQKFDFVERVLTRDAFERCIRSGRAKVGICIPADFSDHMLRGQQAQVQVLIDGSDSQIATTALNTSNLLGTQISLDIAREFANASPRVPARDEAGVLSLPLQVRGRLLYNPNLVSSHFFVSGLVAIIMQLVTLFLAAFSIAREREIGTLEQLFVTPVSRAGLLLGKLVPYAIVGLLETLIALSVMAIVFQVPIRGSLLLLVMLSALFLVCGVGLGLLVSTLARTLLEAMQFAFLIMLPSVLLSGFVLPREQMPGPIYLMTFAIPATHFVEILRGVILRGADLSDIGFWATGLLVSGTVILCISLA